VGQAIGSALDDLEDVDPDALLDRRLEKFDTLGAYETAEPMTPAAH
jgi:acetyl-CoA carboxylase carboxyl transferase subunit alpha